MISIIYNKILIVYIIKLIRKINFTNGYSTNAAGIHKTLVELQIKPCPSVKYIRDILKICGKVEEYIL
jgi:hypothetical protein